MVRGDEGKPGQPLYLDIAASGYLVYELDKGDLKASYVPQAIMKQSLGAAIQQSRARTAQVEDRDAHREQLAAQRPAPVTPPANDVSTPTDQQNGEQNQQAVQANANSASNPAYYGSNGYVGSDGTYYNPYGWSPYIVILPGREMANASVARLSTTPIPAIEITLKPLPIARKIRPRHLQQRVRQM